MKRLILAILCFCLVCGLFAQEQKSYKVQFELKANLIFVDVHVNGKGPYKFIFDTGATVTVMNPRLAKELGLIEKESWLMVIMPKLVRLKSISIGEAKLTSHDCAVMKVLQADLPLGLMDIQYDGIIGYPFISEFIVTIDYKKQELTFVPNNGVGIVKTEKRKSIGIKYRTLSTEEASKLNVEGGIIVTKLAEDSPAGKGGLKEGDVIIAIDSNLIKNASDYKHRVKSSKETLKLTIIRDKEKKEIELKLQ